MVYLLEGDWKCQHSRAATCEGGMHNAAEKHPGGACTRKVHAEWQEVYLLGPAGNKF